MRSILDLFTGAVAACPHPQGHPERDRWVANEMLRVTDVDMRLTKNREKLHQLQERYKAELAEVENERRAIQQECRHEMELGFDGSKTCRYCGHSK